MAFQQLTILANSTQAEILADIFVELGALSVTTEDQFEGTKLEQPIFDEPGVNSAALWEHSKLSVLFDSQTNITQIVAQAIDLFGSTFEYTNSQIDDQDWITLTQNQFQPIKVSDTLYIVPSWHQLPDFDSSITKIILDPGLAFGTGCHPTTFMCLKWLANHVTNHDSVLDYGCGSGILAITAKKIGAMQVFGVDVDNQAIEASRYNASKNQVAINWYLPNQLPSTTKCSIVVANILSNPLRLLAPYLAKHTSQTLILSGILDTQIEEMTTIYRQWFTVTVADIIDGWALLRCDHHE
jgi:ribosomal protein L11 methyltransferase